MTARLQMTLALWLTLSALGCRGGATMQVDQSSNNKEVKLAAGQPLEISLAENSTTGFRWELKAAGGPVCAARGDTLDPPAAGVGKSSTRRWRFEAVSKGTGTIELVYRRAWEQDKPPAETFRLTVRVE
jgi:inhibitor of cysteine peptidase